MRLLDLLVFLGARGSWARNRLAYRLLWSIFVADRTPTRRPKPQVRPVPLRLRSGRL